MYLLVARLCLSDWNDVQSCSLYTAREESSGGGMRKGGQVGYGVWTVCHYLKQHLYMMYIAGGAQVQKHSSAMYNT